MRYDQSRRSESEVKSLLADLVASSSEDTLRHWLVEILTGDTMSADDPVVIEAVKAARDYDPADDDSRRAVRRARGLAAVALAVADDFWSIQRYRDAIAACSEDLYGITIPNDLRPVDVHQRYCQLYEIVNRRYAPRMPTNKMRVTVMLKDIPDALRAPEGGWRHYGAIGGHGGDDDLPFMAFDVYVTDGRWSATAVYHTVNEGGVISYRGRCVMDTLEPDVVERFIRSEPEILATVEHQILCKAGSPAPEMAEAA